MKLLLDTHLLLWAAGKPEKLSPATLMLLEAPDNELMFSAASIWEVAIKAGIEKKDFVVEPHLMRRALADNGYRELPVNSAHAVALMNLPALHKDPFDRILVAQAHVEGIILLTSDEMVARYPGPIQKV